MDSQQAEGFLAQIDENLRAYFADEINYDDFSTRQREVWDAIAAAGPLVKDHVLHIWRERVPA